ncbi:MAG: NAD(P)/FAD-dependent oxidoreductase [Chitinophagaceae bacterium]|nr:MAG: NAD(P)/FAD-dependent oxidoreductase [Chitinophagaceae bacterium]
MRENYDVVVAGSGLGGLVSALILAKEGYSVCVLEKNNQFGGNLQVFVRDKTIFDTGIHYIGGLGEGENLYRYFKYLGIMDGLHLKRMDLNGFDIISFGDSEQVFPHAQGEVNFVEQLSKIFPEEKEAIKRYCQTIKAVCDSFPMYNIKGEGRYDTEGLSRNAKDLITNITGNHLLRAVLSGSNFLYAGNERTPFYVHALSISSFLQSSWRCIRGGEQITKLLIRQIKQHGGEVFKRKEVAGFQTENKSVKTVSLKDGTVIAGKIFISNIEPKTTLKMVGENFFRKSYVQRIQNLESVISAFSLYVVFKARTFKYLNHNFYHFDSSDEVWTAHEYDEDSWPKTFMACTSVFDESEIWARGMTFITYMKSEELRQWEHTFNTVDQCDDRGHAYEVFKQQKTEKFLRKIEQRFPGIRDCIRSVHTSTPLSYRDYIGNSGGNLYGYVKDSDNPMRTHITPKTKVDNLFLTGQSISMHGVLGVTVSAVMTCSEILGKEYLVSKINQGSEPIKDL